MAHRSSADIRVAATAAPPRSRCPRRPGRLLGTAGLVLGWVGLVLGWVGLVLGWVGAGGAGPAAAAPVQSCAASSGVLVAVDFGHWGGPAELGCGPASGTGYDAMTAAGFITAGTQSDGPAFICRIGVASQGTGSFEPTPSQDPCVNTPPLSASWSYWHAAAGQNTWSYSQAGAMSYRPPAGSVDAWTFGSTNPSGTTGQPPFSPEQVRAAAQGGGSAGFVPASPAPASTAATVPVPTSSPPGTGPSVTSPPSTPAAPATPGGTAAATATATATTATTATAAATATTATTASAPATGGSTPGAAEAGPTTTASGAARTGGFRIVASPAGSSARGGSSGPPAASVAGVAVVAVLAGAGGVVAWRRRRSAE